MTRSDQIEAIYLFGAGGHGRELAWLAQELYPGAVVSFVVDDDERYSTSPLNGMAVHRLSEVPGLPPGRFVAAVGDGVVRRHAVSALEAAGLVAVTLVHPRAEISPSVRIGSGAVIAAGSILTVDVEIGAHSHVNIGCTVSHDVRLGSFVTLSPAVHLAGNVVVEDGAFLGVSATVINGSPGAPVTIGANAVVGAGAMVIGDVAPGATVVGVPARVTHGSAGA